MEVVRNAVTAFTEGNVTAALEFLDPEIAIYPPKEDPDQELVYRGRSGALKYLERWLEAWDEFQFDAEELIDAGDRVVVVYRQRGRGKGSGMVLENRLAAIATVRDGKVVRGQVYLDVDSALQAAGLRE